MLEYTTTSVLATSIHVKRKGTPMKEKKAKRQRTGLSKRACCLCREKHEKCDGKYPCDRCAKKHRQCSYAAPKKRGPTSGHRKKIAEELDKVKKELAIQTQEASYWRSLYARATSYQLPPGNSIQGGSSMEALPEKPQYRHKPTNQTMIGSLSNTNVSSLIHPQQQFQPNTTIPDHSAILPPARIQSKPMIGLPSISTTNSPGKPNCLPSIKDGRAFNIVSCIKQKETGTCRLPMFLVISDNYKNNKSNDPLLLTLLFRTVT